MEFYLLAMFIVSAGLYMGSQRPIQPDRPFTEVEQLLKLKPYELFNPYIEKGLYQIFDKKNNRCWSLDPFAFDNMEDDYIAEFMETLRKEG